MISEQMADLQRRVTRLEDRQGTMASDLDEMKGDVRIIRDAMLGAKGGLKFLYMLMAAAVALGGFIPAWLSWFTAKP